MYEHTYDTDWRELSRREAIDRAFALGVAAGCGSPRPAELDRILEEIRGAYDRSFVELAYDEGRTKALEAPESAAEDVWNRLVDESGAPRAVPVPEALPGALGGVTATERPRQGPPSSLDFPDMLRR